MTNEEAIEIREHLITELNKNGFGQVVTEVNTKLEETYGEFERTPLHLLIFVLMESINVLDNLSNKDFEGLLAKFNQFIDGENRIDSVKVELLNQEEDSHFNLIELPNYKEIIDTFLSIYSEVSNTRNL